MRTCIRNGEDVQVLVLEFDADRSIVECVECPFKGTEDDERSSTSPPILRHTNNNYSNSTSSSSSGGGDINSDMLRGLSRGTGPKIYCSRNSADECTRPDHKEFYSTFGTLCTLSRSTVARYRERAISLVNELYPSALESAREVFIHVEPPIIGGGASHLACTPAKFLTPISAQTEIKVSE